MMKHDCRRQETSVGALEVAREVKEERASVQALWGEMRKVCFKEEYSSLFIYRAASTIFPECTLDNGISLHAVLPLLPN